jgi:hypothetical protein
MKKCPVCGGFLSPNLLGRRMSEMARLPRPSVRGTLGAKEKARKAALASWDKARAR